MIQQSDKKITGVILAGGRATRMGGRNKGLLIVDGKPLVDICAVNLRPYTTKILVNTNTSKEEYQALGYSVIDDGDYQWQGPLAGILAGIRHCQTDYIAICACDQLTLPETVYPTLLKAAEQNPNGLAVAHDGKRLHPTIAVVSRKNAGSLQAHLENRLLRVGLWFEERGASIVKFDEVQFYNLNTPMDLLALNTFKRD